MNDELLYVCAVPDSLGTGRICKWPTERVTWAVTGLLPGISEGEQLDAYAVAWQRWADVCGVRPEYTRNARTAHVLMGSGRIDGPSGTLAWSQLPCGEVQQVEQRYDTLDVWCVCHEGMPPRGKIDLVRVACHEIGHALGMPHIGEGNLMAPVYSVHVWTPQRGDIEDMIRRYGPRRVAPPPVQPKPKGGGWVDAKARIKQYLEWAQWVAQKTPVQWDDQLVAFLGQEIVLDLLVFLFERFGGQPMSHADMIAAANELLQQKVA
jgi:hypothetical protein